MMMKTVVNLMSESSEGLDTDSSEVTSSSCNDISDNESLAGEEDPDVWNDAPEDHLLQDITNDELLLEPFYPVLPTSIQTSCLELKSLVQRWTVVICNQHK